MSIRTLNGTVLALALAACGGPASDGAPSTAPIAQAASTAAAGERSRRERVDCAMHYATARDAVLGTLRGTEHMPLIGLATTLSEGVLSPLPEGTSPEAADCDFAQRQLFRKRQADATPPRTLAPACAALIERIDHDCLEPLAQRGVPLPGACHTLIVGLADSREELDRKLGDDAYCASMAASQ